MAGEIRDLNSSLVLDPLWNIANCSVHSDYLVVNGSDGTICVCHYAWGGFTCTLYQPEAPLLRLIATQIICGIVIACLLLSAVVLLINAFGDAKQGRRNGLRIVATIALLISTILKILWLIDTAEENKNLRVIDRAVGGFFWWVSVGLIIFAYAFVIANWLEMLTTKLAVFKAKYSTKLAIAIGVPYVVVMIAFEAIRLSGVVDMIFGSLAITGAFAVGLSISAIVLAVTMKNRIRESERLNSHAHGAERSVQDYAIRVATLFLLVPIATLTYLISLGISFSSSSSPSQI